MAAEQGPVFLSLTEPYPLNIGDLSTGLCSWGMGLGCRGGILGQDVEAGSVLSVWVYLPWPR